MSSTKQCNRCKRILEESFFVKKNKLYSRCNDCNKLSSKAIFCEICGEEANYNSKGEKNGRFCKNHKESGMVNIKTKICTYVNCLKRAIFNKKGLFPPILCKRHKEFGMVNLNYKQTCEILDCKKIPSFNYKGQTKGKYCSEHKENGMICLTKHYCQYNQCNNYSYYGYCGELPSHCSKHKLKNMVSKPKKHCIGTDEEDCKELAIYGENKPLHCEEHRYPSEKCWLVKPCSKCGRENELLNKDGLCYYICSHEKYLSEYKKYQKMKESTMVNFIREKVQLPNTVKECVADKIVDKVCNKYRPDLAYDCGSHIVIVECDENQHKNYNWQSCASNSSLENAEEKRMYEIFIAFELLPTLFIRFNPDNFKVNGIDCKTYTQNQRLVILKKWLEHCFNIPIDQLTQNVKYIKLFYDNFSEEAIKFKTIDEDCLSNKKDPFKCSNCLNTFSSLKALKIHITKNKGNCRPLNCSFCFKDFPYISTLEVHLLTCKEKKRFEEDQSSKTKIIQLTQKVQYLEQKSKKLDQDLTLREEILKTKEQGLIIREEKLKNLEQKLTLRTEELDKKEAKLKDIKAMNEKIDDLLNKFSSSNLQNTTTNIQILGGQFNFISGSNTTLNKDHNASVKSQAVFKSKLKNYIDDIDQSDENILFFQT